MEHILITGAGAGLGREFVKLALADGDKVIAVSLLASELEQLNADYVSYGDRLVTREQDLAKTDAAQNLFDWCKEQGFQIDTLINNAGYAVYGDVVDQDLSRAENMILLNVVTLTKLSSLFGLQMKRRGAGNILNVGSTAGMVPSARFAAYGGSKAYVNCFTVALREELAGHGVNVTLLTPGPVQTKFAEAAQIDSFGGKSTLKNIFSQGRASSAAEVAAAGFKGMRNAKGHMLVGKGSTLSGILPRLMPYAWMPRVFKNI